MREPVTGSALSAVADLVAEAKRPLHLCPPIAPRTGPVGSADELAARRRRRVLLADDDAGNRLLCSLNLRDAGFEVIEAEDGGDALEQALSRSPDVVLTDVEMPGLDGVELAQALRADARTRAVPVVFMSSGAGAPEYARAYELGAKGFVSKPFDPVLLAPLLRLAINRSARPVARVRS
jgi:CheY-like chemotaxis protein